MTEQNKDFTLFLLGSVLFITFFLILDKSNLGKYIADGLGIVGNLLDLLKSLF